MENIQIIYYVFAFITLVIIIFRDRKKSKKVMEQDKTIVQIADDYIALRNELLLRGMSEEEIQVLRDKFTPENDGDFSSSLTEWKKALFSKD